MILFADVAETGPALSGRKASGPGGRVVPGGLLRRLKGDQSGVYSRLRER